jgi:hypothetical protein
MFEIRRREFYQHRMHSKEQEKITRKKQFSRATLAFSHPRYAEKQEVD